MPWSTKSQSLYYTDASDNSECYVLQGFSLTSTEYMASVFSSTSFYDFGLWTDFTTDASASPTTYNTVYANAEYTYNGSKYTPSTYGTPAITINTANFMNNIILNFVSSGNGTTTTPKTCPMIRIPINSDYWLNGCVPLTTINSTNISPYYFQGQCNVNFTATQYQQAITDIAYYCYSTWNFANPNIPIVIILDLHFCFDSSLPSTSGSYAKGSGGVTTNNTSNSNFSLYSIITPSSGNTEYITGINYSLSEFSSTQLPLPGVCTLDMSGAPSYYNNQGVLVNNNLQLKDNTCDFWYSVCSIFGIDVSGNAINGTLPNTISSTITTANIFEPLYGDGSVFYSTGSVSLSNETLFLNNIFFEAFNEPFTEYLCDASANSTTINPYSNQYTYYVSGGTDIYWNGNPYNFTGMSQIYGTIRGSSSSTSPLGQGQGSGATNIIIFGGAENYAFMSCETTSNSSPNWDISSNTIITTSQNCFTTLINYINNNQTLLGITSNTNNIMCCLHPYAGFYSGGSKHPGWYDSTYYSSTQTVTDISGSQSSPVYTSSTPIPGFAQFLDALTTIDSSSSYYVDFPIICTEIGQYDLPFSNYAIYGPSGEYNASNLIYPPEYFSTSNILWNYSSTVYAVPFFNGNYVPPQVSSTPSGFLPSSKSSMPVPAIIGFLMDIKLYNCSFSCWAIRPNAGGNGTYQTNSTNNGYVSNSYISGINNPTYTTWANSSGWSATQPDVTTGSWCSYPNLNNYAPSNSSVTQPYENNDPSPLPAMNLQYTTGSPYTNTANINTTYENQLITGITGITGVSPSAIQNLYTSNTSGEINNNCQGADFGYIYSTIYGATNPFSFSSS